MIRYLGLALGLLWAIASCSQPSTPVKLLAGPLVGSVTTSKASIWIAYNGEGREIVSLIDTLSQVVYRSTSTAALGNHMADTSLTVVFTGLQAGHSYRVVLSDSLSHPSAVFNTQDTTRVRDIHFLAGSCALLNTDISRVCFPGASQRIFRHMRLEHSDFMVWLGDNIYYLNKEYTSYERMYDRNLRIRRKFKVLNRFLASQPNYTIWDDHDYGPNDADKNWVLKDTAVMIYKAFWPNAYEANPATYFTFRYYDAEFYMTDCRWYRDPEGDTLGDYLGATQLRWLEDQLSSSTATFKFICTGSQVLNDNQHGESYAKYPRERNQLLDYIALHNINGVIFLTGDKHYSELSRRDWKGYPMTDFTASPLTSPVISRKHMVGYRNTYNVKGTDKYRKNYGRIDITGDASHRICTLSIYGKGGHKIWDYPIGASELQRR